MAEVVPGRQAGRFVLSTDILMCAVAEGSDNFNFFRNQQLQKLGWSVSRLSQGYELLPESLLAQQALLEPQLILYCGCVAVDEAG